MGRVFPLFDKNTMTKKKTKTMKFRENEWPLQFLRCFKRRFDLLWNPTPSVSEKPTRTLWALIHFASKLQRQTTKFSILYLEQKEGDIYLFWAEGLLMLVSDIQLYIINLCNKPTLTTCCWWALKVTYNVENQVKLGNIILSFHKDTTNINFSLVVRFDTLSFLFPWKANRDVLL